MLVLLKYLDFAFLACTLVVLIWLFIKRKRDLKARGFSYFFKRENISSVGNNFGGILVAFVVLVGGIYVTRESVKERESFMKQHLRATTVSLVHSLHKEHIEKLTFTSEDAESPYFQRITNQIRNYSLFSGIHGIYTIKERGGQFFFGPESFLPEDPFYSEPGTKYNNPPSGLNKVFDEQVTLVTAPYIDEYGSFVSCFSPLLTMDGTGVMMVVGVDIEQKEWEFQLYKVKLLPLTVTLILLFIIIAGFRLMRLRNRRYRFFNPGKFYYWEGIWVFVAGLVLTLYLTFSSFEEEKLFQYGVFSQVVSSERESISGALNMITHTLHGSAQLFHASENVTENEFSAYVTRMVSYPMINSVGWVRQNPVNGFVVEYQDPSGKKVLEEGHYMVSEDRLRFEAILETLYTGVISSTNSYLREGRTTTDLFLRTRDSEGNTSGFVFLSLDLDLLSEAFSVNRSVQNNYYTSNVKMVSFKHHPELQGSEDFFSFSENSSGKLIYYMLEFFFGKTFAISISAEQGFFNIYRRTEYQTILLIGLIVSLFTGVLVLLMSNRRLILEKQVEKQASDLKYSEERFRSLFSNMLEGVAFNEMIFNKNGDPVNYRILELNDAFESLLNLRRKDVVGKNAVKLFGGVPEYFEEYCRVVENQQAVIFEVYSREHDKFLKISAAPWGSGGFATIFTDITLRKKTEDQLKKSEERYRLISENAEDLIWLYDPWDEKFGYVSPSVKKLTGLEYQEVVEKNFEEVLTSQSFKEVKYTMPLRLASFGRGDESMRVKRGRIDLRKKDGNPVPMEVVTTLLADENNQVSWVLGVGRDISDRLVTEEALKKSEEKYRLLIENQTDLIVKVDNEGYLSYVSPSYCKLFGKSEDELLNRKFLPLVHPDDHISTTKAMEKLSEPPHHVVLEQRAMTRDGWKWLSWNDTAVLNEDGIVIEIIGVGRDITERIMTEKALQESRELLERQNEEYSALNEEYLTMNEELSGINEDLSQAIERTEESEKLKTAFLQNMSHEIRTPLNSVIGFSEMLGMDYITDADRKEFTKIIVNSSRQLLELVNDILTISAIETRQDKMNVAPVNIGELVSELYSVFRSKAKEKGILLKVTKGVPDETAVIMTDELKLRQVLINLIGNAMKFTEDGFIELGFEAQEDTYYKFFVKDTGVGISKPMLKKIFERFVQANNSVKGQYGGTGLGLAICKGHIEMMGGEIWLESTPGVGSVFYFTLPLMPD
jgi:PAS domain S-box-containing protein